MKVKFVYCIIIILKHLFERERTHAHKRGRERGRKRGKEREKGNERGRDRERERENSKQAVSTEPDVGLDPTNCKIMT